MLKTVSSITNAIGALNFKGTWDANANSPALASSVGTKGDYYVVGTAGSTNLNGISNWGVGDLATFNGSVWQRVEGGADLNGVNLSVSGTSTLSGLTASTALALNSSKEIVSVTNTGTGSNVLSASPTLTGTVAGASLQLSSLTSGRVLTAGTSGLLQDQASLTFDGINFSIDTTLNPIHKVRTSGSGNNPVYRLQFGSDYWDIQGTGSNVGKELYFVYTGAARAYINSSTGAYVPVSDRRLKKNINSISYGLAAVMALRPVEYNMKTESDDAQKHLGFIAQEAQEVIPSSVSQMLNDTLGMDKTEIIAVLVKAMQEQQAAIDQLKSEIQTLKGV